jgi:hypothetical protein
MAEMVVESEVASIEVYITRSRTPLIESTVRSTLYGVQRIYIQFVSYR